MEGGGKQMNKEYKTVYCVWAYRYGQITSYNYPVGIFETIEEAQKAAKDHRSFRGSKYDHRIYSMPIGKQHDAEEATLVQDVSEGVGV